MVPSEKYNTGEILPRKVTSSSSDHPSNSSTSTNNKILARAQHKISLSAIRHNYSMIEEEAARQKCSVIAVVKADAYGHGAALTSKYLAERCGASVSLVQFSSFLGVICLCSFQKIFRDELPLM